MRNFFFAIIFLLINGCASQLPPSGGPKDVDPPLLLSSNPQNKSLNWNEQEMTLTFNENVQLKDFKNQLLITPSYSGEYTAKYQREEVTIQFEEPFTENTTYTLNFRNGVADLNEGNAAQNLRVAFSTGEYLDSLTITGRVHDLLAGIPMADVTVGLYLASDSITPLNGQPYYLTKSNKAGLYSFFNLKADSYFVYAFLDNNNNATLQTKTEAFGFLSEQVDLDSATTDLDMNLVRLDYTPLNITSARQAGQYFEVKFSKYIKLHDVRPIDTALTIPIYHRLIDENRTLKFYNTLQDYDSVALQLEYSDSLLVTNTDTVYLKFVESLRKADEFKITPELAIDETQLTGQILFSKPYQHIQLDSIRITYDSLFSTGIDTSNLIFDDNFFQITIQKDLSVDSIFFHEPKIIPTIEFPAATFVSIEGDTSASFSKKLITKQKGNTGSIQGKIDLEQPNYILQLINKNQKVVASQIGGSNYLFEDLPAGMYSIRILIDVNNNGKWDGGSIVDRRQPEPVFFFEAENHNRNINLRANWELVDMDINNPVEIVDNIVDN